MRIYLHFNDYEIIYLLFLLHVYLRGAPPYYKISWDENYGAIYELIRNIYNPMRGQYTARVTRVNGTPGIDPWVISQGS